MNFKLFVLLFVFVSGSSAAAEQIVCGKLSGQVVEIPGEYFYLWPNYQGASDWESDRIYNKKGCAANLVLVALDAYWPGLFPAGRIDMYSDKKDGHVNFSIEPLNESNDGKFAQRFRDRRLLELNVKEEDYKYDADLGLFYATKTNGDMDTKKVYWNLSAGITTVSIECEEWHLSSMSMCVQRWYFPKNNAAVDLTYQQRLLPSWKAMKSDIEDFIVNSYKK
jgi:hypothetical protein